LVGKQLGRDPADTTSALNPPNRKATMRRKLTPQTEAEMLTAYEAYKADPASTTPDEIAGQFGVSRETLFRKVREAGMSTLSQDRAPRAPRPPLIGDEMATEMARHALSTMLEELVSARMRVRELEAELDDLKSSSPDGRSSSTAR
jgi:hypothetical protein